MNSENYRLLLNKDRNLQEMTAEEFDSTLLHYAKLYSQEQIKELEKSTDVVDLYRALNQRSIPDIENDDGERAFTPDQMIWFGKKVIEKVTTSASPSKTP